MLNLPACPVGRFQHLRCNKSSVIKLGIPDPCLPVGKKSGMTRRR